MDINPKDFKAIHQLHLAIKDVVELSGAHDEQEYDREAVELYLSWYGLTGEQIKVFRRDAVLEDGIMIGDRKETPPIDVQEVFMRLRDAHGYFSAEKKDGIVYHSYADSEYLIRDSGL